MHLLEQCFGFFSFNSLAWPSTLTALAHYQHPPTPLLSLCNTLSLLRGYILKDAVLLLWPDLSTSPCSLGKQSPDPGSLLLF